MIKAVFDTNIILDFLVYRNSTLQPLYEEIKAGRITSLASEATLYELGDVLARPQFKLTAEEVSERLAEWRACSVITEADQESAAVCRDTDDQKFLNLAYSQKADFLVSRDKLVLKCRGKCRTLGITVLKPEDFMKKLSEL